MDTHTCTRCNRTFWTDEMSAKREEGKVRYTYCKSCHATRAQEYAQRNPNISRKRWRDSKRRFTMPRLYVDANPRMVAYVLDGDGSGYQSLPLGHSSMEAEFLAIIYGLNEYFLKWSNELDSRHDDMTRESIKAAKESGESEFFNVASPADKTKRPLPPPVLICCDNEVVVKQLSRQFHLGNEKLRNLAKRVWQMTENVEVKYQWIPRAENLAGKMLK